MGVAAASPPPLSMSSLITAAVLLVALLAALAGAESPHTFRSDQRESRQQLHQVYDCPSCTHSTEDAQVKSTNPPPMDKDVNIVVTYTDPSGDIRIRTVKSKDLSASWVWKDPDHGNRDQRLYLQELKLNESTEVPVETSNSPMSIVHPAKLRRRMLRQERRQQRAAELIQQSKEMDNLMQEAAIEKTRELDTSIHGRYSIWKKEYENPNSDSTVKLMHDQIVMARAYATIAKAKNETILYDALLKRARESQLVIGEATSDSELQPSALICAKRMGHSLSEAKDKLYDSIEMARKLRAMLQSTEGNLSAQRKKSAFLTQLAAKTVPKPLHCISLRLTTDYYFQGYDKKELPHKEKLEDPSLYHYAIFSDNVLATSVVVSSAVLHAKEPEKHVFHIVTDKLNFAAMRMWFLANPPAGATIQVENIDSFTWLNSSYCPVLRQLESARMIEYYFKAHQASSLAAGADNLKYRNPKYLSMLNHLRFYLPEVYPKLDKILFLDDDIVVQKDLTPLWSVNLEGTVNGAVETCKESFHRFDKYLNFSNPKISKNFDPNACGWAYGMNLFDLKEWKTRNITGIYHYWQNRNEDRTLWKLGTLPPGLITFYNLTHPLEKSWHVLGLGYDPALNLTQIDNAAVVHYNGNYKPWLDLAISKYRPYWSKYVIADNPYLEECNVAEKQIQQLGD